MRELSFITIRQTCCPRGLSSRTLEDTFEVLGLEAQVLGLEVQVLGLGLEAQVLGLDLGLETQVHGLGLEAQVLDNKSANQRRGITKLG